MSQTTRLKRDEGSEGDPETVESSIDDTASSSPERVDLPTVTVEIPISKLSLGNNDRGGVPYEVLDVAIDGIQASDKCRATMKLFAKSKRIVVVAGAGISVAAGIPDFRSPDGLFSTLKADTKFKPSGKALFDASVYQSEAGTQSYNDMISSLHAMTGAANPTPFHSFLDQISPRLLRLYTQNIDSLENRFTSLATKVPLPQKGPWPKTIQLHGDLNYAVCSKCRWVGELDPMQLAPDADMGCMECREADNVRQVVGKRCQGVGIIRPRVVLYHEVNPDADAIGAVSNADISSRPPPDLLVVVGTSLKIPGTKRIVRESIKAVHHTPRGKAIWINLDPPPTKDFDIWIKGNCQRIPALFSEYDHLVERERAFKEGEIKRKEEEKTRAEEERQERRERERIRKEEKEHARQRRKQEKELEKEQRQRRQLERKLKKAAKEDEKERRKLERLNRPAKKKPKKIETKMHRPLTPSLSYDTDSTLSSPSLSDIEYAAIRESPYHQNNTFNTPTTTRVMEYLPTPRPTPQKQEHSPDFESPLLNKKRKVDTIEDFEDSDYMEHQRNSMSIRFLTE